MCKLTRNLMLILLAFLMSIVYIQIPALANGVFPHDRNVPDPVLSSRAEQPSWIVKWKGAMPSEFRSDSAILDDRPAERMTVARPAGGVSPSAWVGRWSAADEVEYIQMNHNVSVSMEPNDPLYSGQNYLKQIRAEQAWDIKRDFPMIIALVDTGVDLKHPDLKDNLVPGVNLVYPDQAPQDDNGHGTSVAGVLAAIGDNKEGVAGVVWHTRIMPIKALEADGQGDEDKLGEGIRYAVDHGAKIVVLSVGLYQYSPYLKEVVDYAESKGVLLVAASGNEGKEVKYPAAFSTVLGVGGVTGGNKLEPESNYGSEIDVVAPFTVFSTALGGGYASNKGTSMAAPQVAGVAALVWSKYPWMKPHQVRNMIRQSAEDIGDKVWDPGTGYGLLRADRAMSMTYKNDIYESNDRSDQAKWLPLDTMVSASFGSSDDQDWFYFNAPYDGNVTLRFTAEGGAGPQIGLVHFAGGDAKGTEYDNVLPTGVVLPVKKGKNVIKAQWANAGAGKELIYTLSTHFEIYQDAFEDNDLQYKAYLLPARKQSIVGTFDHPDDQDWFMIRMDQAGSLQFTAASDTSRMDLAMFVQRGNDKPVKIDSGADGDPEYSPFFDVYPGTYYLRIVNVNAKNTYPVKGEYTLDVNYTPKYMDPNEPNNAAYQASSVTLDTYYMGLFSKQGDEDWFSFEIPDQNLVHFDLGQIPSDRLVSLTLLDSKQSQLSIHLNQMGDGGFQVRRVLPKGKYYVKLSADRPFEYQLYRLKISAEPLVSGYTDISGNWAEKDIVEMTRRQIVTGYDDYTFRPMANVTRAEAVTMIAKAFHLTAAADAAPPRYSDLKKEHWAYNFIAAATQAGVISGNPDGRFEPERAMSRAEMAVMLSRALRLQAAYSPSQTFTDIRQGNWAAPFISALKAKGLAAGFNDGTYRPNENAARAEFTSLLYRAVR